MKTRDVFLVLLIVLLSAGLTTAQDKPKSDTEGLFLNFHLNGTSWDLNDDTDFGELPQQSGGGDERDDYTLVHFDIGAMVTFLGQSTRFRPFGKASFTAEPQSSTSEKPASKRLAPGSRPGAA